MADTVDTGCHAFEEGDRPMCRKFLTIVSFCIIAAVCYPASAADRTTRNIVARGNIQYRQLNFSEALAKYDEAIEKDTEYAIAYNNRGLALHKLHKLEDATAALRKAIELDDKKAAFHLNLGKVYATAGQYDLALSELGKALELDSEMAHAIYNQIWILDERGESKEASKTAEKLLKMEEQPPGTKMLTGIVAAHRGKADDLAAACFDPGDLPQQWRWLVVLNRSLVTGGVSDMPEEHRLGLREAMRAFSTEQFGLARKRLGTIANPTCRSPVPHWLTGMAWQMEGDKKNADEAMKKATRQMPCLSLPKSSDPMELSLDGELTGCAPITVNCLPGAHLIRIVKASGGEFQVSRQVLTIKPATRAALKPDEFVTAPRSPGMVPVPGATFRMGSDSGKENEKPPHTVSVPGFWMDPTEVTNAQYAKFLEAVKKNNHEPWRHPKQPSNKDHTPAYWEDKKLNGPSFPVVGVDWFDAYAYARWAGKRLPTEAEWELAASKAGEFAYPWGNDRPDMGGEFRANYDPGFPGMDGVTMLAPANSFPEGAASSGGLNLAGNVWEWVSDWYSEDYYKYSIALSPKGPTTGSNRVIRGGGWNSPEGNLRASARDSRQPKTRAKDLGFRCVADVLP